jgi:hypothetical protein
VSSTFCAAVGTYVNTAGVTQTLIEAWNGSSWTVVPSANAGSGSNSLQSVSCASSTSCMAVGSATTASGQAQSLVEMWDGSSWSVASSPDYGTMGDGLTAVSCPATNVCVAGGGYETAPGMDQPLLGTWNGQGWSVDATPLPGSSEAAITNLSCASSTACVAVGGGQTTSYAGATLVDAWNGSAWQATMTSPDPEADSLLGVWCAGAAVCTIVGSYTDSHGYTQTLIESGSPAPAPSPSPSPSPTPPAKHHKGHG